MAEFTINTVSSIESVQKTLLFKGSLSANESLASKIQGIILSSPPAGSQRARVKDVFTRTVPTGKTVNVTLQLQLEVE